MSELKRLTTPQSRRVNALVNPDAGILHWLHVVISNAKAFILGTYHGLPKDNLQAYLDEFAFRFSRRSFGALPLDCLTLAVALSRMAD